jgi:Ca2+-binding RTX toxin-like protein
MPLRSGFQLVLLCYFSVVTLTTGYTAENIFGSDGNDSLFGTSGIDEIVGGNGNGADEVMDFNPEQNDTVFLQRKYTEMDINTTAEKIIGESVRVDDKGNVEVQSKNGNWTRMARLKQTNLHINSVEVTGGLQLFFTRRY